MHKDKDRAKERQSGMKLQRQAKRTIPRQKKEEKMDVREAKLPTKRTLPCHTAPSSSSCSA